MCECTFIATSTLTAVMFAKIHAIFINPYYFWAGIFVVTGVEKDIDDKASFSRFFVPSDFFTLLYAVQCLINLFIPILYNQSKLRIVEK